MAASPTMLTTTPIRLSALDAVWQSPCTRGSVNGKTKTVPKIVEAFWLYMPLMSSLGPRPLSATLLGRAGVASGALDPGDRDIGGLGLCARGTGLGTLATLGNLADVVRGRADD